MEETNSKAKIVGFLTIILILGLLLFFTVHLVNKNKKQEKEEAQYINYQKKDISMALDGDYVEYISLGDEYVEKGIVASKNNHRLGNVSIIYYEDNKQVAAIETDRLSSYLVNYTINYSGKFETIYKTVIVIDNKAPKISFPKKTVLSTSSALNYNLREDVLVTDNSNYTDLTYEGNLSNTPGDYIITYKAVDKSGNVKIKKRLIKVK